METLNKTRNIRNRMNRIKEFPDVKTRSVWARWMNRHAVRVKKKKKLIKQTKNLGKKIWRKENDL